MTSHTSRRGIRPLVRSGLIGLAACLLLALGLSVLELPAGSPAQAAPPPGAVFSGFRDQVRLVTGANTQVTVGRLNLPAGSYTISAKLYTTNSTNLQTGTLRCVLTTQGGDFDETWFSHDATVAFVPASLNVVHTYTSAGSVLLTCGHVFASGDTYLRFIKITAVATSNLVNGPLS